MARFIVTKAAGVQFPVGFKFESKKLHPSLAPHVRRIDSGDDEVKAEAKDDSEAEVKDDEDKGGVSTDKPARAPRQQGPGKNT